MNELDLGEKTRCRSREKPGSKDQSRLMVKVQIGQLIVAFATLIVQLETLIKP